MITGNKDFSEMLYDSNNNNQKYCIHINSVDKFITSWKDKKSILDYHNYFKKITENNNKSNKEEDNEEIITLLDNLQLSDLDDSDTENEKTNDNIKNNYTCDEDGNIEFFNFTGSTIHLYD